MKFGCTCGEVIWDNTDYQDNKAYLIPDETFESALEEIAAGKCPWDALHRVKRIIYQCHSCARLYIHDHSGKLVSFSPEGNVAFGILKGTAPDA